MLEAAEQQMAEALSSRDVIAQAKGILMERRRIDPDEAFALLKQASQRRHLKVRALAEEVAASACNENAPPDPQLLGLIHTGEVSSPEPAG